MVLARIEELRPAGVRVVGTPAASAAIHIAVKLVLAGSTLAPADIDSVRAGVKKTLVAEIGKKGVGENVRVRPLAAALLGDARIADVELTISAEGSAAGPANADFATPTGAALQLDPSEIAFGDVTFDKPLADSGQPIPVDVRAVMNAQPLAGVSAADVKTAITGKLQQFFDKVAAGAVIDAPAVLTALRDDSKYGIDAMTLKVTLTAQNQFAQILQGGPAYTAQPRQRFTVSDVEVTA
jgi:hypothetical protein